MNAAGFEPTTSASGGQRSIQLSYASWMISFPEGEGNEGILSDIPWKVNRVVLQPAQ